MPGVLHSFCALQRGVAKHRGVPPDRNGEICTSGVIAQAHVVDHNVRTVPGPQPFDKFGLRLERVHVTIRSGEAGQMPCVCTPVRTHVHHRVTGLYEPLQDANLWVLASEARSEWDRDTGGKSVDQFATTHVRNL